MDAYHLTPSIESPTGRVLPGPFPIERWVQAEAAAGQREVAIDLAEVELPSSVVLVALGNAARSASALGVHLHATHATPRVRAMLDRLGFRELGIDVEDAAA